MMDLEEALWQNNFKRVCKLVQNGIKINIDDD